MNKLYGFAAMFLAVVMVACVDNKTKNEAAKTENSSSAATEASADDNANSEDGAAHDVASVSFQTPDLLLFDLKGNVKTCKLGDYVLSFDESGNLKSYKYGNTNLIEQLKREDGRVVFYASEEDEEVGSSDEGYVEWDGNGISRFIAVNMEGEVVHEYVYHDNQQNSVGCEKPVNIDCEKLTGQGYNWSGTITYTYKKFDDHGNWTEREAVDDFYCDYDGHQESMETRTEKRVITYYK